MSRVSLRDSKSEFSSKALSVQNPRESRAAGLFQPVVFAGLRIVALGQGITYMGRIQKFRLMCRVA